MTPPCPPRLSVVVPVYNGAKTLTACLRSVEQAVSALSPQQRGQVEVIVCDNHSTDNSMAIADAARFDCRARVIQPPKHRPNRTDNWHHGLTSGMGDWLLMLHADDALVDGSLAVWLDAISSPAARDVGFMTARHRNFVDSLDDLSDPHPRAFPALAVLSGRQLVRWVLPLMCPFLPFVLVRRAAYVEVGGFDSRFELTQDWDLWIRLCRRYDVLYVPQVVGAFRVHPTSPKYQRINMAEYLIVLAELEGDRSPRLPGAIRRMARQSLHARVNQVLQADDADEAQAIRERAAELVGTSGLSSTRWIRASSWLGSAMLYGLRARGAVRAAIALRGAQATARAGVS